MVTFRFRRRRQRVARLELIREFAAAEHWQVVGLVEDLRAAYPIDELRSAVSARAELAVRGTRAGVPIVLASVLVRPSTDGPRRNALDEVVVLTLAGAAGPAVPAVVRLSAATGLEVTGPVPTPLAGAVRAAVQQGLLRDGESVVWGQDGIAHLEPTAHLTPAAIGRRLTLIDLLVGSIGGSAAIERDAGGC